MAMRRMVMVETPYRAPDGLALARHVAYARAAVLDCLSRDELPIATHLMLAHARVLDDAVSNERAMGLDVGNGFRERADATVVYTDLGISDGMREAIDYARDLGLDVEYRSLPGWARAMLAEAVV